MGNCHKASSCPKVVALPMKVSDSFNLGLYNILGFLGGSDVKNLPAI